VTFGAPWYLLLLLLVPLALWALRAIEAGRRKTALEYADAPLLGGVLREGNRAHSSWPRALQLAALAALLFSASLPVATLTLPQNKAAIVVALDVSRSMLATDVDPSRLEVAKSVIKKFVELAPADTRIGLVTFSESAASVIPVTTDRQQLLEKLAAVKVASSTSLADPLVAGVKSLPGRKDAVIPDELRMRAAPPAGATPPTPIDVNALPPGAILLLSDGVSNNRRNDPVVAAKFAKDHKVKIYTVAIGKEGGAVQRIDGQDYFIPFDAKSLQQIAQDADGKAMLPTDANLETVFRELGTAIRFEPTKLPLGGVLSGLAVGLLLVSGAMSLVWNRRLP
jgi:Ca-activated chloride channel family protein